MICYQRISIYCILFITGLCISAGNAYAQNTPDKLRETYLAPPEAISKQVLAPRYKNVFLSDLSPNRRYFVNYIKKENFTPIVQYARFFYNLGGLEMDPVANRKRTLTNQMTGSGGGESGSGLLLTNAESGKTRVIQTPEEAHISNVKWSPDGTKLAYFANFREATYIYVADVKTGRSRRITTRPVLATLNTTFDWSADGAYIFTVLVPPDRGPEPEKPAIAGPQLRMTTTKKNRLRTYLYLLQNPYQVKLLKYYITGQYARINVANGLIRQIGKPAMIRDIDVSPDGKYSIVTIVDTPFSYIVPVSRFGWRKEIWDLKGEIMTTLQSREARIGIPNHNTYKFKYRSDMEWRPDGKGLSMIMSSKSKKSRERIYKVIRWLPPFHREDREVVFKSPHKIHSVAYAEDASLIFIREEVSGKEHLFAVNPDHPDAVYTIYNYDDDDLYKDPGKLLKKRAKTGLRVVLMTPDKKRVFLSGTRYNKKPLKNAPRPFIDQVDILSGKKKRIFQSSSDAYEEVTAVLDDNVDKIVVSRESSKNFPNFWCYDLHSDQKTQLTSNTDYNKAVTDAIRKRFKVKRPDGFKFWITVVLPKDWTGKPLPGLIWHYPLEYDNQKDYDKSQRKYNKNQFPRIKNGWPERAEQILTQAGYAVIQADWPIYSERGEPNDAFVYSVQQNSTAVVDSIVARGYVDRDRIAIGGHSYGGFGTINALIHTSFFKAGIAGDANSNRILTPLGFQHEHSDLWRGRSRYLQMSPIIWANRLDGALLMYSGADDQNVGTSPFMSWQLFHALNALGKPASLYMYPYVQHHTNAKEVVLDRWTRWVEWLNHYVKDKGNAIPEIRLASPPSGIILGNN